MGQNFQHHILRYLFDQQYNSMTKDTVFKLIALAFSCALRPEQKCLRDHVGKANTNSHVWFQNDDNHITKWNSLKKNHLLAKIVLELVRQLNP